MCEKFLVMNVEEIVELVVLVDFIGLVVGVCYNIWYYFLNLEVWVWVRKGEFGRVFLVVGSYVQDWLLYDMDYNW